MNIVKLTSENVKKVKAVEITPSGNVVVIGGKNGEGKSSVLDSISYAIEGAASHCGQPVRKGEKKAKVVCEFPDLIVTRTMTATGGTALKITNKDGLTYPTPQKVLDSLIGNLGFDPLAFSRMDPKNQVETLKGLVGLDFSELDTKREGIYKNRTTINSQGTSLKAQITEMPEHPEAPGEEVAVAGLMVKLEKRQTLNKQSEQTRTDLKTATTTLSEQNERGAKLETELLEVQNKLVNIQDRIETNKKIVATMEDQKDSLEKKVSGLVEADEQKIHEQIKGAESINTMIRANEEKAKANERLEMLRKQSGDLTDAIKVVDEEKATSLAGATFPVNGLSFDNNLVLFNEIPFDQASSAEKLRVSVAMGLAMNPKLKVLLIRDGSLLDENSLQMITEMAQKADAQVWIERVSEGDEVSVIIEDGMVKNETPVTK